MKNIPTIELGIRGDITWVSIEDIQTPIDCGVCFVGRWWAMNDRSVAFIDNTPLAFHTRDALLRKLNSVNIDATPYYISEAFVSKDFVCTN